MSSKGFSKLVIAAGVIFMVVGFSMDITVSTGYGRVANIHLASQQQMIVLLGGFIFLGGLILFGVARMKQTREDEAKEIEVKNRRTEEMMQKGKGFATTASDIAQRSSESAFRIGKEAYTQNKEKFKVAAYIIGGVAIAFAIAGYFLGVQEQRRQDEMAKAETERVRIEEEYAKVEQGRRLQFFKQAFASGKFFGFSLDERNMKQLGELLASPADKQRNMGRIKCESTRCNVLAEYAVFAPVLESVQFEYCVGGKAAEVDDGELGIYTLTKIEFTYKKSADAKVDFDALKSESLTFRQLDAETTENTELMSYIISVTRKRGQWDVCGN